MLVQKIAWWLGNQMFQYAYIKALSLRIKQKFMMDVSIYNYYFRPFELEVFNIEKKYATRSDIPFYEQLYFRNRFLNFVFIKIKSICKRLNKNHFFEKNLKFNNMFCTIKNWYIEWYFQSEKYFKDFEKDIRKDFVFNLSLSQKSRNIREKIQNSNSVSIHIRRWDYLQWNNLQYHWICWKSYYTNSIKYINRHIKNPTFFFFSDDIAWARKHFNDENVYFIDWNTWKDSRQDMQLMSLCKHNIIANSSFSWWWAWLNKNKNKIVIAPKKWFINKKINSYDIFCNTWIRF